MSPFLCGIINAIYHKGYQYVGRPEKTELYFLQNDTLEKGPRDQISSLRPSVPNREWKFVTSRLISVFNSSG